VEGVNHPATGPLQLQGTALTGQTLTADTSRVADADGLGSFRYQWFANEAPITGATGAQFVLSAAQLGQVVRVELSFVDGAGRTESLASAASAVVRNPNQAPTGTLSILGDAVLGQTLSLSQDLQDGNGLGVLSYQWLVDGQALTPAQTGTTFVLSNPAWVGQVIRAVASYVDGQGQAEQVQSADKGPVGAPTTIDGATASTSTRQEGNGQNTTTVVVPPISPDRQDQFGNPNLADIPIGTQLVVTLPTGTGLQASASTGGPLTFPQQVLAAGQTAASGGLDPVTVQLVLSLSATLPQSVPGTVVSLFTTGLSDQRLGVLVPVLNPDESVAVVYRASSSGAGSLTLDNVPFALVVGNATLTGGAGSNIVIGDGGNQRISLGADDDQLFGGGGNDWVASLGGNDQLHGNTGDDRVTGGFGDDALYGGSGNDVLNGGSSDAGTWQFLLNAAGQIESRFQAEWAPAADQASLLHIGPWWAGAEGQRESDDRLAFSYQSPERLETVARLYHAVLGELPTLNELNAFSG
jgi:Ca2+-binding RTX toxin-like protein